MKNPVVFWTVAVIANSVLGYCFALIEAWYLSKNQRKLNVMTAPYIYFEKLIAGKLNDGILDKKIDRSYIFLSAIFGPLPRIAATLLVITALIFLGSIYSTFILLIFIGSVIRLFLRKIPMPEYVTTKEASETTVLSAYQALIKDLTDKKHIREGLEVTLIMLFVIAIIAAIFCGFLTVIAGK